MSIYKKNIGIYLHIPFCIKKCPYCDFYSINYDNNKLNLEKKYFQSLIREIDTYKNSFNKCGLLIDTIYFGGGTPSIVNCKNIKMVLNFIKHNLRCKNPEITLEANPSVVSKKYLIDLKKIGVNRLSFGLQSANDDELYLLDRLHTVNDAETIVKLSKTVGFKNISVDLMIGLPDQTMDKIDKSLNVVKDLDIQHISVYMLKIENNTLFNKKTIIDKLPSEEVIADMYLYVIKYLKQHGFYQYEISNFAKPGFESKHNLKYWNRKEYIGFGPSAHSFYNNRRYNMEKNIYKYIGMGNNNNFKYIFDNSNYKDINEYIILKLRLTVGINLDEMRFLYPKTSVNELLKNVKKYYDERYIYMDDNNLKLTPNGFLIFNTIVSNIMVD